MNKKIGEIIEGAVPFQMFINTLRGIFRYGVIDTIKLMARLRRERTTPPQHYLAVCAMAKNEGPYIEEWIEWHRKMGVEKFYFYDNESSDNTKEILAPYIESGLVEYVFWTGRRQQFAIYEDCLEKHRLDAHWIAFIDLDEFIVPQKDKTISEFLSRFEKFSAVEINWLIYGSGGAKKKEAGGVMERFKCHSNPNHALNRYIKTIVNPRRVVIMISAHKAATIFGRTADSHGKTIRKNYKYRSPKQDVIRINHYIVKSYEEFLEKSARGNAISSKKLNREFFNRRDLNDIREV